MFCNCFSNWFQQQPLYFEGNSTSTFHSALSSLILYLQTDQYFENEAHGHSSPEKMKTAGGEMTQERGVLQILSVANLVLTRIVLSG